MSAAINKVFGIGMSKTGTSTLATCLRILGFVPHKGYDRRLVKLLRTECCVEQILDYAEAYRSFEDNPWYSLYKELDQRFPGSKFILTLRKNAEAHAQSSWYHGVRSGVRSGSADPEYLEQKMAVYNRHNNEVIEYFRNRPDDLLVVCWENGDRWEALCEFLHVPKPRAAFPHDNRGSYPGTFSLCFRKLYDSAPGRLVRQLRSYIAGLSFVDSIRSEHLDELGRRGSSGG